MKQLFEVQSTKFERVLVFAGSYDEAGRKAENHWIEEQQEKENSILDEDGSLNIGRKKELPQIKRIELVTDKVIY